MLVFLLPFFFCALSHKEGRFSSFGSVGESVVFLRHCSEDDAHLKREMLQLYLAFDWMLRLLHFWDLRILYCRALWIFKTCLILWFEAKFDKHLSRKKSSKLTFWGLLSRCLWWTDLEAGGLTGMIKKTGCVFFLLLFFFLFNPKRYLPKKKDKFQAHKRG